MTVSLEMMEPNPLIVAPDMSVKELAALLLNNHLDGACVLDQGDLIGVVTSMDLVFQETAMHLPSFLSVLDFVIPLEKPGRFEEELKKLTGSTVAQIMTRDPISVELDSPMEKSAQLMIDHHLTMLPVLDENKKLAGVITKVALLRHAYKL